MNSLNKYFSIALTVILFAGRQFARADLQVNTAFKPKQVETTLKPLFNSVVLPYNTLHAADFGGSNGRYLSYPNYSDSNFAWDFNGKIFYSNISAFVPEIASLEDCKPDPNELIPGQECEWRRKRYNVCHLYMFDSLSLKLENVTRLDIKRDRRQIMGLPRCNGVHAMAIAKVIPDAMLITINYIDSAAQIDPRDLPPEYFSTVLLRFRDESGKLKIEQDDSCLGNPNKHKTIAAARKALTSCSKVQK